MTKDEIQAIVDQATARSVEVLAGMTAEFANKQQTAMHTLQQQMMEFYAMISTKRMIQEDPPVSPATSGGGSGIQNIRWSTELGKLQFTFKAGDTVNEDEWIDVHEGYAVLVEVSCPPV